MARWVAVAWVAMASSPVLASPISLLDADRAAIAAPKLANAPTTDSSSTVRPIAALPVPPAGGGASATSPLQSSIGSGSPATAADGSSSVSGLGVAAAPATDESASGGGTLRDVLRSIVTLHQSDGKPAPVARLGQGQMLASPGAGRDELNLDLRKLILDSEVAGTMLRSIVEVKSADAHGGTFSIFGLGNFALDVAPDLHAAVVSELSSGMGFKMSFVGEGRTYEGLYPQAALNGDNARVPGERVNLVRVIWNWILDFLTSPIGALVSMAVAIALFLWIGVKSVGFLQRRASRYEH